MLTGPCHRAVIGLPRALALAACVGCVSCLADPTVPKPPDSVVAAQVDPPWIGVAEHDTVRLRATLRGERGDTLRDRVVVWSTLDATVAQVDQSGLVVGITVGTTRVAAATEGRVATTDVVVAPPVLVGAGDIADCVSPGAEATAELLDTIPGMVFTAGDNAYPSGSTQQFASCYAPTWGRHAARTRPSPGNHDYATPGAAPYFAYFGTTAGDPRRGYYSYDFAGWHIVVLNSNVDANTGSEQVGWLRSDLANHRTPCTVAMWHHPLFTSGRERPDTAMAVVWGVLYDAGVDIVINGHDHDYERFSPQTREGTRG